MNGLQELDGWEGEKEVERDSVGLYEARGGERESWMRAASPQSTRARGHSNTWRNLSGILVKDYQHSPRAVEIV